MLPTCIACHGQFLGGIARLDSPCCPLRRFVALLGVPLLPLSQRRSSQLFWGPNVWPRWKELKWEAGLTRDSCKLDQSDYYGGAWVWEWVWVWVWGGEGEGFCTLALPHLMRTVATLFCFVPPSFRRCLNFETHLHMLRMVEHLEASISMRFISGIHLRCSWSCF